ncbi:MAG: hypothetical protein HZC02_01725 [Candidatus Levybacteria bacterium]|nr:hypothetical protein [Candidatus Levybacteria bacterium]
MRKYDAFFFYYTLLLVLMLFAEAFLTSLSPHFVLLPFVLLPLLIFLWLNLKRAYVKQEVIKHEKIDQTEPLPTDRPHLSTKTKRGSKNTILITTSALGMLTIYAALAYRAFTQPSLSQLLDEQIAITKEITAVKDEVSSLYDIQKTNSLSNDNLEQLKEEIAKYQKSKLSDKEILSILGATTQSISSNSANENTLSKQSKQTYVMIKSNQGSTLDVYAEKYSSSKVVGQMKQGITYSSPNQDGNYYMIELSADVKGWVNSQYLKEL